MDHIINWFFHLLGSAFLSIVPVIFTLIVGAAIVIFAVAMIQKFWGGLASVIHYLSPKTIFLKIVNSLYNAFGKIANTLYNALQDVIDGTIGQLSALFYFASLAVFRRAGQRRSRKSFITTREQARAAAEQREQFVARELERTPGHTIIEMPPGLPEIDDFDRKELSRPESIAQRIRLEYQTTAEMLLFGRLVDTLTYLTRLKYPKAQPTFDVSLRRLRRWERRSYRFDWIATIGVDQWQLFEPELVKLQEWLGIGVEFTKPAISQLQRACLDGSPKNIGTVLV
jgi:hypothetical protein